MIRIETLPRKQAEQYFQTLAEMRLKLFKEYHYLYEGDIVLEQQYLKRYFESEKGLVVLAVDKEKVIGLSIGYPLSEAGAEFQTPFLEKQKKVENYFYLGDILLLELYRNKIGYRLLRVVKKSMESFAQQLGYHYTTFLTVIRAEDHPSKPKGYRLLVNVWKHFGYRPSDDMRASIAWPEAKTRTLTMNQLQFWTKQLLTECIP